MSEPGGPDSKSGDSSSQPPRHPSKPPHAIVLTGYVEPGRSAGYVRLYLDTTRRSHIDVLEGDIRHREPAGGDVSKVGAKPTLWIRRDASLEYTAARS